MWIIFEVRVKSKKSVRKVKTPFRSIKRLSSLEIVHIHGLKDVDVNRVITWGSMPPYLRVTVCEYVIEIRVFSAQCQKNVHFKINLPRP